MNFSVRLLLFAGLLFLWNIALYGVYEENIPRRLVQPDGSVLNAYLTGDEFFNYLHDAKGYTIVLGDDGWYYYAGRDNEAIVATVHRAGSSDPEFLGLERNVVISPREYQARVEEFRAVMDKSVKAPLTGQMTNLVVYIRFSDDTEFTTPRSVFDQNFNAPQGPSLKHYFQEVSYQQLDIQSHHFPVSGMTTNISYQDQHPRSYYMPYHAVSNPNGYDPNIALSNYTNTQGRTYRQHTLLASAINAIQAQVPQDLVLDADNDGNVDNVSFIIKGQQGEWNNLLWAHRWVLWSQYITLHGLRVYDFTFQPEAQSGIYVICHEMFHTLGAPDLYRYSHDGFNSVGPWDLMHSGFVHMGAHMKHKYGNGQWIEEIPIISEPGTYTLEPLYNQTNNAFRILSPENSQEHFVVEYRRRQGHYETNIPGEGLIIYRIFPQINGNAQGPPDEVYVFRPGGTLTSNGNIFQAHFSLQTGRTEFHDFTDPNGFMMDGSPAGIYITNITAAGQTISFDLVTALADALPPENLVATPTEDFDMLLQWEVPQNYGQQGSPQLDGYLVYRNMELIHTIDDPEVTSFLDVDPPAGEYEYFLRAVYSEPEAVSHSTNVVIATMPGYFIIEQGTEFQAGWEAGSITLEVESNVAQWTTYTSSPWIQVSPIDGSFDEELVVWLQANNSPDTRIAYLSLVSDVTGTDTEFVIQQQGHPSLVQDLNNPVFEMFPNPVQDGRLTLRFNQRINNGTLSLMSMDGRQVMNVTFSAGTRQTLVLDIGNPGSGVYLLVLQSKEQVVRKKVIVP